MITPDTRSGTDITVLTVDVCIVYDTDVLLIRRSESKKAFPGWLAFPGGHIEDGENPMAAAVREVYEETGIGITDQDIRLKYIAFHTHRDRNERYIVFGFYVRLAARPHLQSASQEGDLVWMRRDQALRDDRLLPPVLYYADHVMYDRPGVMYNSSIWEKSSLVRVIHEYTDRSG